MLRYWIIALTLCSILSNGQTEFHYLVNLKYKAWGDLSSPDSYLSPKSIQKRTDYNVTIDSTDIPVNPSYLDSLNGFSLNIEAKSKWHNCVVISSISEEVKDSIMDLSIVESVELIGERTLLKKQNEKFNYNESNGYISPLDLQYAHDLNLTGSNIDIAILDAGFDNLNFSEPFQHLFEDSRIKSTYDFVRNSPITYTAHTHGSNVASFLAAKQDSFYVGTAPDANYHFLITEDINQENLIEEFHLIEALEYCDSVGVDVVNISLGYNEFDDDRFSHERNEFTGYSNLLNKACNIGWRKGLFILSSSGNEGNKDWEVTTCPANADSVFTIGSVNKDLKRSSFSSKGNPYFLNTQKPNVVSIGEAVNALNAVGSVSRTGGTSYSCPQIAGFTACLMQSNPQKKNWEIRTAIEKSAHNYNTPDSLIGYGIPNFKKAFLYLLDEQEQIAIHKNLIVPNPNEGSFIYINESDEIEIKIVDGRGAEVFLTNSSERLVELNLNYLNSGIYYLIDYSTDHKYVTKFIIY